MSSLEGAETATVVAEEDIFLVTGSEEEGRGEGDRLRSTTRDMEVGLKLENAKRVRSKLRKRTRVFLREERREDFLVGGCRSKSGNDA